MVVMRNELTWRELKGLHKLYLGNSTRAKLLKNVFVKNTLHKRLNLLQYKDGNPNIIIKNKGFDDYFRKNLLDQYLYYADFFESVGIEISAKRNYSQYILDSLVLIFKNKEELRNNLSTPRIFSSNFFKEKDSKFLDEQHRLKNDILTILGVEKFPSESSKEEQWLLVVHCIDPKYILICENIDFLKYPFEFRKNHIELWYLGGNNTRKLNETPKSKMSSPLFYVCDWDFHGLGIFTRVKQIIESKGEKITLLLPEKPILKPINSGNHDSKWNQKPLSGLDETAFDLKAKVLIEKLISENKWIEEQTIDPIPLIKTV